MIDDSRIKAEEKDKLLVALKNEKNSGLSDKLIAMSEILQKSKLETRKAVRKVDELEEREHYISRLLSNRTSEVGELELGITRLEKELSQKEERWRLQDNDRM